MQKIRKHRKTNHPTKNEPGKIQNHKQMLVEKLFVPLRFSLPVVSSREGPPLKSFCGLKTTSE